MSAPVTELTRPAWTEQHDQEDTGVRWSRHAEVEVLSGSTHTATDTIAVEVPPG